MPPEQGLYARKFEVVIIRPLDTGDFLVMDRKGKKKYVITPEILAEEYEDLHVEMKEKAGPK